MRKEFLSFSPPCIGEEEIAEVVDALRSDWITTGPKVKRFEEEFAAAVDAPAALALSSCTAALHLALVSLGIGRRRGPDDSNDILLRRKCYRTSGRSPYPGRCGAGHSQYRSS